jgi:uncharacterized membrane protein YgdD (TMEM256/DUF423 family)
MTQGRGFAALGAGLAFLGVAAGAFGTHVLEGRLAAEAVEVFDTAVRYQMYHAIGLLFVGVLSERVGRPPFLWAGRLFVVGTAIFSGTLYVLAVTDLKWLGAVTPLGGVCLLGGWAALCWGIVTLPYSPGSSESS